MKKFQTPEAEIAKLAVEDVICTSVGNIPEGTTTPEVTNDPDQTEEI